MRRALPGMLAALAVAPAAVAAAPPVVSWTCNGSATCEDVWFTSPVRLDWTVAGATPDKVSGCQDTTISRDTRESLHGCIAGNDGPVTIDVTLAIRLDQTPPSVSDAVPDRPPDHAGWYTRPVAFTVVGADATSGIDRCDRVGYAGPDDGAASVLATCRDRAGHVASRVFPLRYDATPPDANGVIASTGDRRVRLRWPAVASATVLRTPGLSTERASVLTAAGAGITDLRVRNGIPYRYVVTLADEAGNAASRELVVTPGPRLLAPDRRARVAAPPRLRWTRVRGARYYNVQLFRHGRKILSAWPRRTKLQLTSTWRYRGRRYRLHPGEYRWYVWPGKGPRSAREYGARIGARSFVVAR